MTTSERMNSTAKINKVILAALFLLDAILIIFYRKMRRTDSRLSTKDSLDLNVFLMNLKRRNGKFIWRDQKTVLEV